MKKPFSIQLLIFFFLIYAGCRDDAPVEIESPEYTYTVPSQRNDGWATSSLEEAGLNSQNISDLVNFLYRQRSHKIHSILIAKNEKIVFEKYFSGYKFNNNIVQTDNDLINYDIDTLNFFANGTKSITALIAGMMINEGYNLRLDDQIKKYYPQYSSIFVSGKSEITLRHLLNMTAGLDWFEYVFQYDDASDFTMLMDASEPLKYILNKELITSPGIDFNYSSGNTILVYDIINKMNNIDFISYVEDRLFAPLQINHYKWDNLNDTLLNAASGIHLTSRDLLKLGQIYSGYGKWKDLQLVSRGWIEETIKSSIDINIYNFSDSFGLHWWKYSFDVFSENYECIFSAGWGEQYIFVFPSLNLVVVITGGYFFEYVDIYAHMLVRDYILKALQ